MTEGLEEAEEEGEEQQRKSGEERGDQGALPCA